jgi:hypothetical protein
VKAARWHERAQAKQEIPWRKAEDTPPISEAAFHFVQHGAISRFGEATHREWRAQTVAAEPFETNAVVCVQGGAGMQRKAILACAQMWQRLLDEGFVAPRGRSRGEHELRLGLFVIDLVVESTATTQNCDDTLDDTPNKSAISASVGGLIVTNRGLASKCSSSPRTNTPSGTWMWK